MTDHAGNTRTVRSAKPFYIVKANPDSVQTLILKNTSRMVARRRDRAGASRGLDQKLQELAPTRASWGSSSTSPSDGPRSLYGDWDADPGIPGKANAILFGCHGPRGVRRGA